MLPGFRYHVVTISAIFFALGIGVLIGSSFVKSTIVEGQTTRLDRLSEQFKNEISQLRDQNQRYGDLADVFPGFLRARLGGLRIALIQTGDYPDTVRRIRETLEKSGSVIASVTIIDPGFPAKIDRQLPQLAQRLRPIHPAPITDKGAVIRVLATAIAKGAADGVINVFADSGLVQRDGDYLQPVDGVVVVGGASDEFRGRAETVDLPLLSEVKLTGVHVVFAEPATAVVSYISALRSADIATVDNADSDIGVIAVAIAILSPAGDYGTKPTARSGPFPPPPSAP